MSTVIAVYTSAKMMLNFVEIVKRKPSLRLRKILFKETNRGKDTIK